MNIRHIARVCHEANKGLCDSQGDKTQLTWAEAPNWQRESAISGVKFKLYNPDATAEDQHKSWSEAKLADGWKFGSIKNEVAKEHPCLVPYAELPVQQQAKDYLFAAIVTALKPFLTEE